MTDKNYHSVDPVSIEVPLSREEMAISEEEYDIQEALGSLPVKYTMTFSCVVYKTIVEDND